jgi:serine/threonine protein kinase
VNISTSTVADEALLLEAMLLNGLRHPNVLKLVAIVSEQAPVLLCVELMQNGDLRGHLRACRPNKASRRAVVSTADMLTIGSKLASAMAYLEQQSIIHRDLAARNVLVGECTTDVKIADLGAARNVHRSNEASYGGVYTATSDHNPARWMPLEALAEAKFSHKSDVFAFGVLLWEVLALGQTPWGAFGVKDFVDALSRGERLQFPPAVADDSVAQSVYSVCIRCWTTEPRKRPPFVQLATELAVQVTVAAATRGGETAARSPAPHNVGDCGAAAAVPTLDSDGYVEEPISLHRAGIGHGYVNPEPYRDSQRRSPLGGRDEHVAATSGADLHAPRLDGMHTPQLDGDGYVEDTISMPLDREGQVCGSNLSALDLADGVMADQHMLNRTTTGNEYVEVIGSTSM